jgi:ER lumen protein retaining receptor
MILNFLFSSRALLYFIFLLFWIHKLKPNRFKYFRIEFLIGPTILLSLVLNHEFSLMEILWTFSIYLESVAILPQLFMVQKTGEAESITSHYLFALGSYRALYILNWIYRYYVEGSSLKNLLGANFKF